jgi:hypothetical protein
MSSTSMNLRGAGQGVWAVHKDDVPAQLGLGDGDGDGLAGADPAE